MEAAKEAAAGRTHRPGGDSIAVGKGDMKGGEGV
jgi:hypothetical protein